jgi:hypothetical protein
VAPGGTRGPAVAEPVADQRVTVVDDEDGRPHSPGGRVAQVGQQRFLPLPVPCLWNASQISSCNEAVLSGSPSGPMPR